MEFSRPLPRKRTAENIVPMINVVFLLLIFFLMSAQIAPPRPVDITVPDSGADGIDDGTGDGNGAALYLTADGVAHFAGLTGPLALGALADAAPARLTLHADAGLPAADLARLLPQLGAWGIEAVELVTAVRP